MVRRITLSLLATLLPFVATAQDKCAIQYQAEQDQIVREFTGKRPAKGDKDAELAWSKNMNAALAASAKRAEDCTRSSKPALPPVASTKEQECLAGVSRRLDELERRYRGRTLTAQEQTARRGEEDRLFHARMSCASQARR